MSKEILTISPKLRWGIWERDNFTCKNCGIRRNLTIDHIIPLSKGGKTEENNLQTLCVSCNAAKGNKERIGRLNFDFDATGDLFSDLVQIQNNASDYEFSNSLGISQQLWQMTRTGKADIGLTIIKAVAHNYPQLALDVLEFLGFDVKEVISLLTNHTDAPETSPHQNSGDFIKRIREIFKR